MMQANQNNAGQDEQIVDQGEGDLGAVDDIGGDWNDEDDDFGEKDDAQEEYYNAKEAKEFKDKLQDDLLFNIQGVGTIKKINGYDVFVKNKDCETSLNYLYRSIKNENEFEPWVKQILGQWKFLQNHLIPLLIIHKKDRKLSFLACRLMVQLTEYPRTSEDIFTNKEKKKYTWTNAKSIYNHEMLELLRGYKESFLQQSVVQVLMEHLADCLQEK